MWKVPNVGAQERYTFEVLMPGGHSFERRDPWARETEFESDICTVINPRNFTWTPFQRPEKDALVMYQCHVGTFTGMNDADSPNPGTFSALTRKLDYIANMGFTCLQLLPHTEFGQGTSTDPIRDCSIIEYPVHN